MERYGCCFLPDFAIFTNPPDRENEGAGPLVWSQIIKDLVPNTDYDLSAWVASAVNVSPAQLQFSINSDLIGPVFTASTNVGLWENWTANWNSGDNTSVEFLVINHNPAWINNYFALDDISFTAVTLVPESSSVLGLLAFAALGAGSSCRRKLQRKATNFSDR